MEIFVKTLTYGEVLTIIVEPTTSIKELRSLISKKTKLPIVLQSLIHSCSSLTDDTKTVSDYGIKNYSTIYQMKRLICTCCGPNDSHKRKYIKAWDLVEYRNKPRRSERLKKK